MTFRFSARATGRTEMSLILMGNRFGGMYFFPHIQLEMSVDIQNRQWDI